MAIADEMWGARSATGGNHRRIVKGLKTMWRSYVRRRALAALLRLNARQLEDVGLTHAEIDWGLDLPFYVDAAHAVSLRASERRAAEEAARRGERKQ